MIDRLCLLRNRYEHWKDQVADFKREYANRGESKQLQRRIERWIRHVSVITKIIFPYHYESNFAEVGAIQNVEIKSILVLSS